MARKTTAARPEPLVRVVNQQAKMSFVECHAEGHQWRHKQGVIDPLEAEPGLRAPFGGHTAKGRRSTCANCGMERVRWYTRSGEVQNRYKAADGYYHVRDRGDDTPAPTRLEWRQTLVSTLFEDDISEPRRRAS